MADVRRLMELGMPGPLAAEVAAQIDAAGAGGVTSVNGQTGAVTLDASGVGYTPSGNLTATDVQGAIDELEANKADNA